jgi:hypothetical protein
VHDFQIVSFVAILLLLLEVGWLDGPACATHRGVSTRTCSLPLCFCYLGRKARFLCMVCLWLCSATFLVRLVSKKNTPQGTPQTKAIAATEEQQLVLDAGRLFIYVCCECQHGITCVRQVVHVMLVQGVLLVRVCSSERVANMRTAHCAGCLISSCILLVVQQPARLPSARCLIVASSLSAALQSAHFIAMIISAVLLPSRRRRQQRRWIAC